MTLPKKLMAGKRGLIMGVANDHSIAWGIAQTLHEHGAELAFTYQGDAFGKRVKPLVETLGAKLVLPADVEDEQSLEATFSAIEKQWGGLDFLVHAIAFSDRNELKGRYQTNPYIHAISVTLPRRTHAQAADTNVLKFAPKNAKVSVADVKNGKGLWSVAVAMERQVTTSAGWHRGVLATVCAAPHFLKLRRNA